MCAKGDLYGDVGFWLHSRPALRRHIGGSMGVGLVVDKMGITDLPHVLAVRRENIICRQISDFLSAMLCRSLNSPRSQCSQQLALFVTWRPST